MRRTTRSKDDPAADGARGAALDNARAGVYGERLMNADGSTSTVAEIVEEMLAAGTERRLVDAWLFGLERERELRDDLFIAEAVGETTNARDLAGVLDSGS